MMTPHDNHVELVKLHNWIAGVELITPDPAKALQVLYELSLRTDEAKRYYVSWDAGTVDNAAYKVTFSNPRSGWKYSSDFIFRPLQTLSVPFLHTLCKKLKKEIDKGDNFGHFEDLYSPGQATGRFSSLV